MRSIPVTILGGSDQKRSSLPESGAGLHPLATYKGVAIRVGGRPLVELLVERLASAEGLGPVTIAGPARLYEPLGLEARVVDTDASVALNLRAALDAHAALGGGPLAVLACDVLPTSAELAELRRRFEAIERCALWFPFVRKPDDPEALGAFAWKPTYRVVPAHGEPVVEILPGHLGVFDPASLRLPLLFALMDAAYRTRNHSLAYRRVVMLRKVLFSLLAQDFKLLFSLRKPNRTLTVVRNGLRLVQKLRTDGILLSELEHLIGRIFLRTGVPVEGGIRYTIVDMVSLAEDIDTEEEAEQLSRELESRVSRRPASG